MQHAVPLRKADNIVHKRPRSLPLNFITRNTGSEHSFLYNFTNAKRMAETFNTHLLEKVATVSFLCCWADTSLLARFVIYPALEKQCAGQYQQHSPHYLHVAVRQVWPLSPAWGCLFTAKSKNTEEARMVHLWEVRHAWHTLKLRCQLANFNGWPHVRHFEKTVFKRQSAFPGKKSVSWQGAHAEYLSRKSYLAWLMWRDLSKIPGFFYLRMSAFITFLVFFIIFY